MTSSEMKKYFKKQQMKSFFAIVKDYKRYYLGSLLWLNAFKILNNKAKMQKWQQKHKERYENLQLAIKKYKWTKNAILQSKIWLNSKEFKEKYLDTNHPYPPLLNPNDIDYEIIPAELVNPLNLNRQISLYFTKNFTHFMNYIKKLRIANPLNIDNLTKMDKDIFIGVNFSDFDEARVFALKLLSQGNKMFGLENISNINFENIKFALSFGITSLAENIQMFDKIKDKPIIFYEDSYLSCVTLVNSHNKLGSDIKFEYPRSFFLDDLGQHFNVFCPSRLEVMLNDVNLVITDKQKQEARKLIDFIVKNKLSKYNNQPIYKPIIGNYNRKKVLVIEQAMADYSIYMSGANDYTFEEMLQSAILENPNCDIIVKRHPESVLGFKCISYKYSY